MIAPLIYFLLFGLMFFIIPFNFSPYEVPKVLTSILFIGVLVMIVILNEVKNLIHNRSFAIAQDDKIRFLIFLFLTILAIYDIPNTIYNFWGNDYRPQGTLVYLSLFLLFLIARKLPFNLSLASKITSFVLPILLVVTVLIGPRASFRFIGPVGESNALGTVVLFLFPFTSLIKNKKLKILSIFSAVTLILMTGSRIALLAFVVEILIIYLKRFHLIFIPGIITSILIFIFSIILPFLPHQIPKEVSMRFENRAEIWTVSYLSGFDSPILGQGFGSVESSLNKKAWEINNFIKYQPVDSAHNLILNWWIMAGSVGVLILTSLIVISLKNLYQQKNWILLSILIGLLMIQMFNPVSIVTLVHFWWLLGLSLQRDALEG